MVSEPWIHKIRKKKCFLDPLKHGESSSPIIGILSFEVANAMSRAVNLHRSLSDSEISNLHNQILSSPALRTLISPHKTHLLALAVAEKLDELNRVASIVSRLGHRCSLPALQGFEHVYSDLLSGRIDPSALGFLSRDIDNIVRKMERFASSTASLYTELESLAELEISAKKFASMAAYEHARKVFDERIHWQRHDVKLLRDSSLWNQSYDKVVLLLARAVCTIHYRICCVFGDCVLELDNMLGNESRQLSGQIVVFRHLSLNSGVLGSDGGGNIQKSVNLGESSVKFSCRGNPGKIFMECLSLSRPTSWNDGEENFEEQSCFSQSRTGSLVPFSGQHGIIKGKIGRLRFGPKCRLTMLASSSTIGGSALALHYANIIIIIEKLLSYPHLVGDEAKDDLYQMLPASLRAALRKSLKYYVKDMAIYDASLAHDWKETIKKILSWISPMANKMIRWQAERNFEQQQIILRGGVLLLQTLYFADKEKTEAAICELLVGLNYICRYEQQQNALLDCTSSVDFDDGLDWLVQC